MTDTDRTGIETLRHVDTGGPALTGVGQVLPRAAAQFGDRTALVTAGRTLTYVELDEISTTIAAALSARGVRPGDRVSIYAGNRWEWIAAYHGALKSGAVVNPVNAMLTPDEVRFVLRNCESSVVFAGGAQLADLGGLVDEVESLHTVIGFDGPANSTESFDALLDADASAWEPRPAPAARSASTIGYTSGTTGHPKGAVQSHEAVLLNCLATAAMHGRSRDDVMVTALPAPHVYGNVAINSTFLVGGTVVLMERFDPRATIDLIVRHGATMFEGVPAMYSMLLAEPALASADLTTITRSTVGGQTIAMSTIRAWEAATQAPLLELWGMTELAGVGTTHWWDRPPVPGSIGVAVPGLELRVSDFDDPTVVVAPGQPGELMARGPYVLLEYFDNPGATAEAVEPDGWFHTGDVATMDEDGYVFVVDRRKDMIITAGFNVYPAEIERVIAGHEAVAMVAVGSVPDDVKGELARAYVVLREGHDASADEIIAHARTGLAAYKVPRSVEFVPSLPQTSTGKIMRRKLSPSDG